MRMIDADAFMENVRKELNCDERCCECVHDNLCEIYKMTLKQPTVYDVDKVVELLVTNSMLAQVDDEPFVMLDDAVEIVKSGGIE